jgi:hypothetical protein
MSFRYKGKPKTWINGISQLLYELRVPFLSRRSRPAPEDQLETHVRDLTHPEKLMPTGFDLLKPLCTISKSEVKAAK